MRRSTQVAAPFLASAALALLGCRQPEMQRCVDETGKVVDDSACRDPLAQRRLVGPRFHYYYGGSGTRTVGSFVGGGSDVPVSGHTYSTGTVRGGFGQTFSEGGAHASGGGE